MEPEGSCYKTIELYAVAYPLGLKYQLLSLGVPKSFELFVSIALKPVDI